jgi:hypothetical protein
MQAAIPVMHTFVMLVRGRWHPGHVVGPRRGWHFRHRVTQLGVGLFTLELRRRILLQFLRRLLLVVWWDRGLGGRVAPLVTRPEGLPGGGKCSAAEGADGRRLREVCRACSSPERGRKHAGREGGVWCSRSDARGQVLLQGDVCPLAAAASWYRDNDIR